MKHTLIPILEETLKLHMPLSSLESRTLWLTVWHSDMFGRNDFLGEVSISLAGKVFDNPQPQWYLLQERSEPFDELLYTKMISLSALNLYHQKVLTHHEA